MAADADRGRTPGRGEDSPPTISGFDHSEGGKVHYGGQAVIEGVMMRGPTSVATAVRLPDGRVSVKRDEFVSASRRHRVLRFPVVRGGLTLIESLALGIKALNYSASVAIDAAEDVEGKSTEKHGASKSEEEPSESSGAAESTETEGESFDGAAPGVEPEGLFVESEGATATGADRPEWKTNVALTGTMVFAFALGIVIFFVVPMMLSDYLTRVIGSDSGVLFNVIDGVIRVTFFLVYLWAISRWKEMRRVFEYHGAEHKVIFTQEEGLELTPDNARAFTTRHPRCGTSFLLIVMVVSILVFMIFGKPPTIGLRLTRLLLIPVIAGVSYEIMKFSAKKAHQTWAQILSAPGVWLQGITTKEPTDEQVEVAIAALKAVRIDDTAPGEGR